MHTRDFRRPRGRGWLLALFLSSGCTTIPSQFEAYRQACAAVREQSEIVLADYQAAHRMKEALEAPSTAQSAGQTLAQRLKLGGLEVAIDPLALDMQARMDAWDVIQRYNDALVALSTGAKPAELEGAVNGLLDGLQAFPLAAVADAATDLVPWGGVAKELLGIVQREVEARRFRDAVLKAEQPMEQFGQLLLADAGHFYDTRFALQRLRFATLESQLVEFSERASAIAAAHAWPTPGDVEYQLKRISETRFLTPGRATFDELRFAAVDTPPAPSSAGAELLELTSVADSCERFAQEARVITDELVAYDELMRGYAQLLREFVRQQGELARAVRENSHRPPSVALLKKLVTTVNLARHIYSQTR